MSSTGSAAPLQDLATGFARTLQDLLRATICPDATFEYKAHRRSRLGQPTGVVRPEHAADLPVRWEHGDAIASLRVSFNVTLDERVGQYLMVHKSMFALVAAQVSAAPIIRWEYERDKRSYSPAHIQVHGTNEMLERLQEMAGNDKPMRDVHFPAGSKRYRPAIEDVVEFMVHEGYAHPLDRWGEHVKAARKDFARHQLRAAVAGEPMIALDKLGELGILTVAEVAAARERVPVAG